MHVCMNMNSLHILLTIIGGEVSTIYKAKQRMKVKKHKANSIKPFKTSSPLATIAEMGKRLWKIVASQDFQKIKNHHAFMSFMHIWVWYKDLDQK